MSQLRATSDIIFGPELIVPSCYLYDHYKPEKLPKASPQIFQLKNIVNKPVTNVD